MKQKRIVLATVVLAWYSVCTAGPPLPIIDVHMHAYPADILGAKGAPNPATGKPSSAQTDEAIFRASIEAMDRYNIVKAVVSGPSEVVANWRDAAPSRFLASPQFPLFDDTPDPAKLHRMLRDNKYQALAELTFQYVGVGPSDAEVDPYFALAEQFDIPIGFHMGLSEPGISYGAAPGYRANKGSPLLLEEALIRHPKARVYIMHAGWPFLDDTIALMWAHPQVYAGLGVIDWVIPRQEFHAYLQRLMQAGLGKRLMFGSDQMVWPESIGLAIEGIESASFLNEEEKRDIFYNNAARFLRIETP